MIHYVRKAVLTDLSEIMKIIHAAKELLQRQAIPQWRGNDGPTETIIHEDIVAQRCYVAIVDGTIAAIAVLSFAPETPYDAMEQGRWQEAYVPYAVIHRFAVAAAFQGKGIGRMFMAHLFTIARLHNYRDVRIDTHPKNHAMQRLITHTGFTYCGTILLTSPDGERFAYQIILTE